MGVVCVARLSEEQGMSGLSFQQLIEHTEKVFNGRSMNRWQVNINLYKDSAIVTQARKNGAHLINQRIENLSILQQYSLAELKKHSNNQLFCFKSSNMEKGFSWSGESIIEAEGTIFELMKKLKNVWTVRQTASIEGLEYMIGDFLLRFGSLYISKTYKGIILEVEYKPCTSPKYYRLVTEEFLREFLKDLISKKDPSSHIRNLTICDINPLLKQNAISTRTFGPFHIALQYKAIIEKDKLF